MKSLTQLEMYIKKLYWSYHSKKKYAARQAAFRDSATYWEQRYREGGNSGAGSYGQLSAFKTKIINQFVKENTIESVLEFGCGDGNQLIDLLYPSYTGFDVSKEAIAICRGIFDQDNTKKFEEMREYKGEIADLSLSLDVIYHLVEDNVFEDYMNILFNFFNRFVIVYSSNENVLRKKQGRHVKHRLFTSWVDDHIDGWHLKEKIKNDHPFTGASEESSYADFYIYEKLN